MATKPDPDYGNDRYSEEETAKRRDATIRAMIAMPPKPRRALERTQDPDTTHKSRVRKRPKQR
jgi:hypothetical protein